jgi:hypothetical protein
MDFVKMRKDLKCFVVSSCLLAGQFPHCWTFSLSSYLLVEPHPDKYTHLTAQRYTTQMAFQVSTPKSGTHYCTPDDGHSSARNMLSQ